MKFMTAQEALAERKQKYISTLEQKQIENVVNLSIRHLVGMPEGTVIYVEAKSDSYEEPIFMVGEGLLTLPYKAMETVSELLENSGFEVLTFSVNPQEASFSFKLPSE